jgi:hypothetical protein
VSADVIDYARRGFGHAGRNARRTIAIVFSTTCLALTIVITWIAINDPYVPPASRKARPQDVAGTWTFTDLRGTGTVILRGDTTYSCWFGSQKWDGTWAIDRKNDLSLWPIPSTADWPGGRVIDDPSRPSQLGLAFGLDDPAGYTRATFVAPAD